jgi:hypothetical protein
MQPILFVFIYLSVNVGIFCCIKKFHLNILGFICIGLLSFSNLSLCIYYVIMFTYLIHGLCNKIYQLGEGFFWVICRKLFSF